jgi:hypothetical protein
MNEERRYALHERLDEVLGPDQASTLMEHLPPATWNDLVRQRDMDSMRLALTSDIDRVRSEMTVLRIELQQEINALRVELHHEIGALRAELHHEIGALRAELHHEIANLRSELIHEMDRRFSKQMWQFIATSIGLQALTIAAVGIMFANMN